MRDLDKVVEALKNTEHRLYMANWVRRLYCGTTVCAIGAFCLHNPKDDLRLDELEGDVISGESKGYSAIAERFDITYEEAEALFGYDDGEYKQNDETVNNYIEHDKEAVIYRLEHFIKTGVVLGYDDMVEAGYIEEGCDDD